MLGDPEARESPPFRMLCQVERVSKRLCDSAPDSNGSEIENREARLIGDCHSRLDAPKAAEGAAAGIAAACPPTP